MSEKFLHRMDNGFEGSMPLAWYRRSTALFASTSQTSAAGAQAPWPKTTPARWLTDVLRQQVPCMASGHP